MLKGAMHIHSTYSDGEFTLAELREVFLAEECSFVCVTDHAEYFDEDTIARYVRECDSLSDEKLRMIAGLEYRCDHEMHVLGYGATVLSSAKDPQEIFPHIKSCGAISVIAHPKNDSFSWIESFEVLPDGIETWNSKYDGRYAPRPGTFALLQRLRQRSPEMHAFYGQDLHWKNQFRQLFVELEIDRPAAAERHFVESRSILEAVATGKYNGRKGEWQLPSSGVVPEDLLAQFGRLQENSSQMWRLVKGSKNLLDRAGIPVPESLKAALRRIF